MQYWMQVDYTPLYLRILLTLGTCSEGLAGSLHRYSVPTQQDIKPLSCVFDDRCRKKCCSWMHGKANDKGVITRYNS